MSDDARPTGHDLAMRLFDQGLAPPGCSLFSNYYEVDDMMWEPWLRIEDCWYLVEQWKLNIEFSAWQDSWWVGEAGLCGVTVPTFAELPTAICQAALKVQDWWRGGPG